MKLALENKYKIVVPLFGAAFAVTNKDITVLFCFRTLSTVLIPTVNRSQGLFKAFAEFFSLFMAYLIFKDFSRKPSSSDPNLDLQLCWLSQHGCLFKPYANI